MNYFCANKVGFWVSGGLGTLITAIINNNTRNSLHIYVIVLHSF